MCLELLEENKKILTATEDIVCWKLLIRSIEDCGDSGNVQIRYYTPYRCFEYFPGTTMKDKLRVDKRKSAAYGLTGLRGNITISHRVTQGCFHTYKNREDAMEEMKKLMVNQYYHGVVVKCVIPKDTKYYEGFYWNVTQIYPSYASKELVVGTVDEMITPENINFINERSES